jgi:hypothetical protein
MATHLRGLWIFRDDESFSLLLSRRFPTVERRVKLNAERSLAAARRNSAERSSPTTRSTSERETPLASQPGAEAGSAFFPSPRPSAPLTYTPLPPDDIIRAVFIETVLQEREDSTPFLPLEKILPPFTSDFEKKSFVWNEVS